MRQQRVFHGFSSFTAAALSPDQVLLVFPALSDSRRHPSGNDHTMALTTFLWAL